MTTLKPRNILCFVIGLALVIPVYNQVPEREPVPENLPAGVRTSLIQRAADLDNQYKVLSEKNEAFKEKYKNGVINGSPEKAQANMELAELQKEQNEYVSAVDQFNEDVRRAVAANPGKTIGAFSSMRGEFSIENSDGSRLTNLDIQTGSVTKVNLGMRVITGPTGHLQCLLMDETVFTIGPNSEMVIDEFVYDPEINASKITARLAKGIFRWVTGKVARKDPAKMKVTLPVGTIGIRGTDFETKIEPDGSGYIKLFSGELEITPTKDGRAFILNAKQMIKFNPAGVFGKPEPISDLVS
jgi:hypothetical protein